MPQVTVYIRQEDIELWKGVIKKSEFMHNALEHLSTYDGAPIVLRETLPATRTPIDELKMNPGIFTADELKKCKNGHALDSRGKGCKYA